MPREHRRSTLHDEQVLRRRIPQLWTEGAPVLRCSAGGEDRPDDLRLSASHQVHLPQIWPLRYDSATRLVVHPAAEHRQRENVHFHLVLVRLAAVSPLLPGSLSLGNRVRAELPLKTAQRLGQGAASRGMSAHQLQNKAWRLVDTVRSLV